MPLRILLSVSLLFFPTDLQQQLPLLGVGASAVAGTPTLAAFLGKNGDDDRGANGANNRLWNFDAVGPGTLNSGDLLVISGMWPDVVTSCATHCPPTFTDNNANTLTGAFTVGNCLDGSGFNHGIYFEQNIGSGTKQIKENHGQKVTVTVWDAWAFYNMATTGGVDGANGAKCTTGLTPANNTAPNISGTALSGITSGDLVIVQVDEQGTHGNTVSSITVPTGCSLTDDNPGTDLGLPHWTLYCKATSTSFTPQFTVAQTTHDTFTIYAAAFKAGGGGSAPGAGPKILSQTQFGVPGNGTNKTINIGCPAGTTSLFVVDDASSISSVADSNTNTFSSISTTPPGNGAMWVARNMTTTGFPNTYTVTLTVNVGGNNDLLNFYCTNITTLDTSFTTAETQVTTSTISNTQTSGTGGGNCQGTVGTLVSCTDVPTGTPGHTGGELFIVSCVVGNGPVLQSSQPSNLVADFVGPAVIADITNGDSDDYLNGDMAGHFYQNGVGSINFGWHVQQNTSAITCVVNGSF